MFNTFTKSKFLFASLLLATVLGGCGDKESDASPEHDVEVRFKGIAIPYQYMANFYVEEDEGEGATTTLLEVPDAGNSNYTHHAEMAKRKGHTVEAMIFLSNHTGSTAPLSSTIGMEAEIVVDGEVKKTVKINSTTPQEEPGEWSQSVLYKLD